MIMYYNITGIAGILSSLNLNITYHVDESFTHKRFHNVV